MSEREQVWRERIDWQPWSGLTVANRKRDDRQKRREKIAAAHLRSADGARN